MRNARRTVFSLVMIPTVMLNWSSAMADESTVLRKMVPGKTNEYTVNVEKSAMAWTDMFLSPQYAPPANARYVFLPANAEQNLDMLRMRYDVRTDTVTITQTACIFMVSISRTGYADEVMPTTERVQTIQDLARRLFSKGESLVLSAVSQGDAYMEGRCERQKPPTLAKWLDGLQWSYGAGEVTFAFIKDDGRPSAMDKGFDEELNERWFGGSAGGTKRKQRE